MIAAMDLENMCAHMLLEKCYSARLTTQRLQCRVDYQAKTFEIGISQQVSINWILQILPYKL
jgi:hypothetical protein